MRVSAATQPKNVFNEAGERFVGALCPYLEDVFRSLSTFSFVKVLLSLALQVSHDVREA